MRDVHASRREFLKLTGMVAGAGLVSSCFGHVNMDLLATAESQTAEAKADVEYVNDNRLSFLEPEQRPGKFTVVGNSRNDSVVGNFNGAGRDPQRVIGLWFSCLRFRCRQ